MYRVPDNMPVSDYIFCVAEGSAICFGLSFIFYHSVIPGLAALPVFLIIYIKEQRKKRHQKRMIRLRKDFKDLTGELAAFLLAGYSVENAMKKAYQQMSGNSEGENDMMRLLGCMLTEIRMGESAENAWLHFSEQAEVEEIQDFGQIFALSKRSGASLPQVLRQVSGQLNRKVQTEMQIETQISGKKAEQKIMNLMPAGILIYICVTSPEMMQVMYTTLAGRVVMTVCLAVYLGAFELSKKMTDSFWKLG